MSTRNRVGTNYGAVTFGANSPAYAATAEPAAFARVRDELDRLTAGLGQVPDGEAARVEVVELRRTVTAGADPEQVRTRWTRLRDALVALGVTGAVAFGADLTQLSQGIAEVLGHLGGG